jgi:hypothetical protein
MSLKDKDALDFFNSLKQREDQKASDNLTAAKADAAARGKEPFDYKKLEGMCQTIYDATMRMNDAERAAYFEELYYVGYPNVTTLSELADKVNELSRWM